jgi:hypothetical protein
MFPRLADPHAHRQPSENNPSWDKLRRSPVELEMSHMLSRNDKPIDRYISAFFFILRGDSSVNASFGHGEGK